MLGEETCVSSLCVLLLLSEVVVADNDEAMWQSLSSVGSTRSFVLSLSCITNTLERTNRSENENSLSLPKCQKWALEVVCDEGLPWTCSRISLSTAAGSETGMATDALTGEGWLKIEKEPRLLFIGLWGGDRRLWDCGIGMGARSRC